MAIFHSRCAARGALRLLAIGVVAAGCCGAVDARVTRIVIDTKQSPAYSGATFGTVGQYEILRGRAFGEIDPLNGKNTIIQDIALAPRNATGKVEYIATFSLIKPVDLTKSNRVMVYNVVNRGGRIDPGGSADGYVYLESGWQGDLLSNCVTAYPCVSLAAPYGGTNEVIQVPVPHNADGSSVTGPVLGRITNGSGAAARQLIVFSQPVPYKPVSLDPSQSTLTTYTGETIDGVITGAATIPSTEWAWAATRMPSA